MPIIRNQNVNREMISGVFATLAKVTSDTSVSESEREAAAAQIRGAVEANQESISADEVAEALDEHHAALSELGSFIEARFKVIEDRIEAAFQALHRRLDALGPRASEPPKSDPTPNG